jgi:hypothetical protein
MMMKYDDRASDRECVESVSSCRRWRGGGVGSRSLVHFQSQFDDRAVLRSTDDNERADPPWRSALAKIVHKIRQRLYIEDHGPVSHGSLPRHGSGTESVIPKAIAMSQETHGIQRGKAASLRGVAPSFLELRDWMILGQNGGPSKNQTPSLHTFVSFISVNPCRLHPRPMTITKGKRKCIRACGALLFHLSSILRQSLPGCLVMAFRAQPNWYTHFLVRLACSIEVRVDCC